MFGFFNYFRVIGSALLLPLSGWFLMLFGGAVATDLGINPFGYGTSLLLTLGLWLTVAPMGGGFGIGRMVRKNVRKNVDQKWARYASWMDEPDFGWSHKSEGGSGTVIDT